MINSGKLISTKQLKIDKANKTILIVLGVSSFIVVFSIIASKSLINKFSYQNRVNTAMQTSLQGIQNDQLSVNQLVGSYNSFINKSPNVITGNLTGPGTNVGSNSKIIKDSLPAVYDFPALATSIQALLSTEGVQIQSISGTDSVLTVNGKATPGSSTVLPPSSTSSSVTPTPIPFSFEVTGTYSQCNDVLKSLEKSIRPIVVESIDLNGSDSSMNMKISAHTFYLPPIGLSLSTETIQ